MPNTTLGFTYPSSLDTYNPQTGMQTLATSVDTYIAALLASMVSKTSADSGNLTGLTTSTIAVGSPIVGVAFTAPASGRVLVTVNGSIRLNSGTGAQALFGAAIRTGSTVGSGTLVNDPSNEPNAKFGSGRTGEIFNGSASQVYDTLTPGGSYNASFVYYGAGTSPNYDLFHRRLDFVPVF